LPLAIDKENCQACHLLIGRSSELSDYDIYGVKVIDEKKFYDGFAATIIGTQTLSAIPGSSLYAQVGYKTKRYVPGESFNKGLIARGGLAFTF